MILYYYQWKFLYVQEEYDALDHSADLRDTDRRNVFCIMYFVTRCLHPVLWLTSWTLFQFGLAFVEIFEFQALLWPSARTHGKPGEAYTRLKTASCEAGPGTTHMCTLEICIWSLHIPNNADRCAFNNSIFDFWKSYLYIDPVKFLNLSCQGSNHHPSNNS